MIMDYEKKYKEALERAENIYNEIAIPSATTKGICTYIFPELKESEDERIKKELIAFLKYYHTGQGNCVIYDDDWIAWLEKQGEPAKLSEEEQNKFAKGVLTSCALSFINYLDAHKYKGKMCVSNGECEDIENAFHNAMWDRLHRYYCKYIEKQGEQKPAGKVEPKFKVGQTIKKEGFNLGFTIVKIEDGFYYNDMGDNFPFTDQDNWELVQQTTAWSEEDEKNIESIESFLRCPTSIPLDLYDTLTNWLKTIRPQKHWKPSEEQINALYDVLNPSDGVDKKALESLYEQLKAL